MRTTIGGDKTFETLAQRLARERQERRSSKGLTDPVDSVVDSSGASSFLWIPGEDEDADLDIFKL
jgi:hypothetical protein